MRNSLQAQAIGDSIQPIIAIVEAREARGRSLAG